MSVIAEIQVEGDFVLSELLTELPEVRVQFERIVPAGERTVPLVWIHTADPDPVEQALREHERISSIIRLDSFEDEAEPTRREAGIVGRRRPHLMNESNRRRGYRVPVDVSGNNSHGLNRYGEGTGDGAPGAL